MDRQTRAFKLRREGQTVKEIADALGVHHRTISKWFAKNPQAPRYSAEAVLQSLTDDLAAMAERRRQRRQPAAAAVPATPAPVTPKTRPTITIDPVKANPAAIMESVVRSLAMEAAALEQAETDGISGASVQLMRLARAAAMLRDVRAEMDEEAADIDIDRFRDQLKERIARLRCQADEADDTPQG